jgi:enoyl-CoA hydratase/carnithine racemase
MQYETILVEKKDHITTITLNRPEKLNALNPRMFAELVHAFRKVGQDDDTRVLVITGAGRGFCSGVDLTPGPAEGEIELEGVTPGDFPREAPLILSGMKKPVIAAINGVAVGGGLTLTLSCDIRIASEAARFSLPLTRLGFTFELGSSYFLSRVIGIGKACELIFTGRMIDAAEAREIGLVNRVVPPEQLSDIVYEMAGQIAKAVPLAQEVSKAGLYQGLNADLPTQLRWEVLANAYLGQTEDRREAIRAFAEKREPVFKGR